MIGRTIWRFGSVDSTQNVAFRLAELGAMHGTVVRADYQSAGRGRQGKSWEAPRGSSLMFSMILRPVLPVHQLGSISIRVADVLANSIEKLTSASVQVKWPNDVLVDGRKISGVLLQTRSGADPVAILGMGINVSVPAGSLPHDATSLSNHVVTPIDSERLFTAIITDLDRMWDLFAPELSEEQLRRMESRLWQQGKVVSILDGDREIHGCIEGLAASGELRLSIEGSERLIVAGEIVRGPRPIQRVDTN